MILLGSPVPFQSCSLGLLFFFLFQDLLCHRLNSGILQALGFVGVGPFVDVNIVLKNLFTTLLLSDPEVVSHLVTLHFEYGYLIPNRCHGLNVVSGTLGIVHDLPFERGKMYEDVI